MTSEQEEKIRLRALEIWREQGCPEGRAGEHWEQAEREIGGDAGEGGGNQAPDDADSAEPTGNPPANKKGGQAAL